MDNFKAEIEELKAYVQELEGIIKQGIDSGTGLISRGQADGLNFQETFSAM